MNHRKKTAATTVGILLLAAFALYFLVMNFIPPPFEEGDWVKVAEDTDCHWSPLGRDSSTTLKEGTVARVERGGDLNEYAVLDAPTWWIRVVRTNKTGGWWCNANYLQSTDAM